MAARRKYDSIRNNLHNDWCRENGYPVRVRFTSYKLQAASIKLQATSCKLPNNFSLIKFPVSSRESLYQDNCILRMLHMKRNLMW